MKKRFFFQTKEFYPCLYPIDHPFNWLILCCAISFKNFLGINIYPFFRKKCLFYKTISYFDELKKCLKHNVTRHLFVDKTQWRNINLHVDGKTTLLNQNFTSLNIIKIRVQLASFCAQGTFSFSCLYILVNLLILFFTC